MKVRLRHASYLELLTGPIRVANSFGLMKKPPKTFATTNIPLAHPNTQRALRAAKNVTSHAFKA